LATSSPPSIISDYRVAAELLRQGRLVAFPTETVYGLGADATNAIAVSQIFEAKQRPTFDPLIVHIAEFSQLEMVVQHVSQTARQLMDAFWPGPLTLVLPKRPVIPDLVTSGLPGVGIRMPAHPLALQLLREAGCPVAAPSANPFGGISPTTAQHVADGLGNRVHCILDGGPCSVGVESTVVSLMGSAPIVLRPGGCPVEEIEKIIGPVAQAVSDPSLDDAAQPSPGMLSRHYAPGTPLSLVCRNEVARPAPGLRCGLLTYGNQAFAGEFERIERLCAAEDLQTCAAGFFATLRSLDSSGLDVIIAHKFPQHGLGIALNDRLTRAACRE
jgi:L-threonylcarbamoyladenylate synthase